MLEVGKSDDLAFLADWVAAQVGFASLLGCSLRELVMLGIRVLPRVTTRKVPYDGLSIKSVRESFSF